MPTGIGFLEELATDKKLQKKLKEGDAETVTNTVFGVLSPVPLGKFVPKPLKGVIKKGLKAGKGSIVRGAKALGKGIGKGISKMRA